MTQAPTETPARRQLCGTVGGWHRARRGRTAPAAVPPRVQQPAPIRSRRAPRAAPRPPRARLACVPRPSRLAAAAAAHVDTQSTYPLHCDALNMCSLVSDRAGARAFRARSLMLQPSSGAAPAAALRKCTKCTALSAACWTSRTALAPGRPRDTYLLSFQVYTGPAS